MRTKQVQFWILGVVSFFGLFLGAPQAFAVNGNISGYIWGGDNATLSFKSGSNFLPTTGWSWGNNAGNRGGIGFISLGDGTTYGLYADDFGSISGITGVPGNEGYAWSSNYGWINFNAGCPSNNQGAKIGSNTYTGCNAQFVNPTTTTESGSLLDKTELIGWARACSVFKTDCSGGLKEEIELGGWDGWISLSRYNDQNFTNGTIDIATTSNYHVSWNPVTTALSGYAWGGSVTGWINFAGATMEAPNQPIAVTLTSPNTCSVAGGQISLTWGVTGTGASTYFCTGTSTSVPQKWLGENAVPSQTKTVTVGAVPDTFIISCTSSNPALPDISASFTTSSNVCSGPVLKIEPNPTWTKTVADGTQCVDPGDVYSPQVTLDLSSISTANTATARCDVNWGNDIGFQTPGNGPPCNNRDVLDGFDVFGPHAFPATVSDPARFAYYNNPAGAACGAGTISEPGILLNGRDQTPGSNFGRLFTEYYPPTDLTTPSAIAITQQGQNVWRSRTMIVHACNATGHSWMTLDFKYPREVYFDKNQCTTNVSTTNNTNGTPRYTNKIWTINDAVTVPLNNTVTFKTPNGFEFKLNDNLSPYYATTAHNDASIGPHEQCIVFPSGKNLYINNSEIGSTILPSYEPVYAKPQPPYDRFTLPYCELSTTLSAKPDACQVYGTSVAVDWSVPSTNATTCTASIACTNANGSSVACAGWSGSKSVTAGMHTESVTITATGGAQELYATLSLTCDNPTSGKSDTSTAPTIHIQPNAQACIAAAVCGNAALEAGEQCDAGASNGIACTPGSTGCTYCGGGANACQVMTVAAISCGDGNPEDPEECDDGVLNGTIPTNVPYGGSEPYCGGTGMVDDTSVGACTKMTVDGGFCGDGITQTEEYCDASDSGYIDNGTCNVSICAAIIFQQINTAFNISPACIVSGDGQIPVASWSSDIGTKCDATGDTETGFNMTGGQTGSVTLFPGYDNYPLPLAPILDGTYVLNLICTASGAFNSNDTATLIVKPADGSCGSSGTSAPIQPVFIDS